MSRERMVGRLYTSPMQLLVSVRDALEANYALEGGADIIDAKEPLAGALGPVSPAAFGAIVKAVGSRRPVSAALGDAGDEQAVARQALAFARAGAVFVKIGFAGVASPERVAALMAAAKAGADAGGAGLIAVAYADGADVGALSADHILDAALRAGTRGVLLDTVRKDGPSSLALVSADRLAAWVGRAREAGVLTSIAGRLMAEDLTTVLDIGADIAGIRGAACDGGRDGLVSAARVRHLRTAFRVRTHHTPPTADRLATSAGSRDRA